MKLFLVWFGVLAALCGLLFGILLWTCAMPQFWGTGVPVRLTVRYLVILAATVSVVGAMVGTWTVTKLFPLHRPAVLGLAIMLSALPLLLGKCLATWEENAAMKLGTQLIKTQNESPTALPEMEGNRIRLHRKAPSDWSMSIRGEYVPWWEINYSSADGWYYVVD